jgi:uncharacterized membrane protein YidH (DUF202 family)
MEENAQPFLVTAAAKEEKQKKKEAKDEVAYEKLLLSLYRAQLAMIRTATTMTTFGFALYKLLNEKMQDGRDRPMLRIITPRIIGLVLFFAGIVGLISYSIKHIRTLKKLNRLHPSFYYSGVMLMTYVLFLLTLFLFIGVLIND